MENVLTASYRHDTGKVAARQLRRQGQIPAVCYGSDRGTFNVTLDPNELRLLLKGSKKGRNQVIQLTTDGESHQVMVQEIQRDPLKRTPVHVDFLLVKDEDHVTVPVPITSRGRSRAERNGGSLAIVRRSIDVRCMVKDIPEAVDVDVTELVLGGKIRASELVAPPGGEIVYKNDFVIISGVRPRGTDEEEEEEEEVAAI